MAHSCRYCGAEGLKATDYLRGIYGRPVARCPECRALQTLGKRT